MPLLWHGQLAFQQAIFHNQSNQCGFTKSGIPYRHAPRRHNSQALPWAVYAPHRIFCRHRLMPIRMAPRALFSMQSGVLRPFLACRHSPSVFNRPLSPQAIASFSSHVLPAVMSLGMAGCPKAMWQPISRQDGVKRLASMMLLRKRRFGARWATVSES